MATLNSNALTTVADVKESMGISNGDTSKDNLIIRKINQASTQIENYCGRSFHSATYTDEVYDATNTDQLILKNRPVTGVTTLKARDTSLNISDTEDLSSELYFINSTAGVLDLLFQARGRWGRFLVTYTGGYSTIPSDLAEACATLAAWYVNEADATSPGLAEKQEGQRRIRYANTMFSFDELIKQLGIDGIINSYANYPILADR